MFDEANLLSHSRSVDELIGPPGLQATMRGFPSRGASPMPQSFSVNLSGTQDLAEELRQARREIEALKSMNPFRAADMAIELQVEKMRISEVTNSRDSAIQRLTSAYDSIKEKVQTIARLEQEKAELEERLAFAEKEAMESARSEENKAMENEIHRLQELVRKLSESAAQAKSQSASPSSEVVLRPDLGSADIPFPVVGEAAPILPSADTSRSLSVNTLVNDIDHLSLGPRPHSVSAFHGPNSAAAPYLKLADNVPLIRGYSNSRTTADAVNARNLVLSSLPIPPGIPDDILSPILIPSTITIHEFLGNIAGPLRDTLNGYRVFHEKTTRWCPDKEEHGYFLTPLYKCSTKARVPTAHQWSEVDPRCRMTRPTECFYSREGKWYYAGQYIALRLDELSVKEWEELDHEATSMIVKETLAGRKNISPTVHYEVSQLYGAGALKVSCVGLQCVGFNKDIYSTILDQASKCQQTGRWKTNWAAPGQCISDFPVTDDTDNNSDFGNIFDSNSGCTLPPALLNFM